MPVKVGRTVDSPLLASGIIVSRTTVGHQPRPFACVSDTSRRPGVSVGQGTWVTQEQWDGLIPLSDLRPEGRRNDHIVRKNVEGKLGGSAMCSPSAGWLGRFPDRRPKNGDIPGPTLAESLARLRA